MSRLQAALTLLAAIPVMWALMWWGWRGKARREAVIAPLAPVPADLGEPVFGPVEATYVSTTQAGDYLARVVAHRLGVRSAAAVGVHRDGLMVARLGEPDLWLPVGDLVAVRRQRGMLGKFADADGVVVVTWRHGDDLFDSGLRTRYERDREPLVHAVSGLVERAEENTNG